MRKTTSISVEWLKKFTVHDKPRLNVKEFSGLKKSIVKDGITKPVTFSIGVMDGLGWLKDGHHRLWIAEEVGLQEIPIEFEVVLFIGKKGKSLSLNGTTLHKHKAGAK